MKLTLTTDEGEVIAQWNVEEAFGDVSKFLPRNLMSSTVSEEIVRSTPLTCHRCRHQQQRQRTEVQTCKKCGSDQVWM